MLVEKRLENLCSVLSLSYLCLGCPFHDDTLSSKKALVGFNHKSSRTPKNSAWSQRLKNTEASLILLWEMVHNQWSDTPQRERKPLNKTQLEDKAQVAALACF